MKLTVLLSAALMAGGFSLQATTQSAAVGTNTSPEAAMAALFGNPAVVKAKGFEIKRSDFDEVVSAAKTSLTAANTQVPPELEASVLDKLITIQVLLQTATDADQAAGKIEADQQFTNVVAQFGSPEEFQRLLKARGMTVEELRARALQEAVAKAALKRALNINPTDEDAMEYYKQHAANFERPEMVHARHILLTTVDLTTRPPTPLTTNTIAAKRRQIEDLRKRILAGEDFAVLAKQYSEDTGSKENGGELPEFARGQMVAEFESAAFSLPTNQVSEVVTSQFGFHLIKVLEKLPAKKMEFDLEKRQIKEVLIQIKIGKVAPDYLKKLRADQQVEIQDATLKSQDDQILEAQAAAAAAADTKTGVDK